MRRMAQVAIALLTLAGAPVGNACTLGSDVLQEVPNPGVTHIKGMYGMEDASWATFYTSGAIRSGVYRVDNPDEENGYIEVSNGEAGYGCHSTYSYDVFVWNGHGGSLCSEGRLQPPDERLQLSQRRRT